MKREHSTTRRATAMLLAALAIAMLGSIDLAAQRFQWVYGGPTCREAGRGGVKQLAGGGYIAVGESYSTTPGCVNSHIYAVLTNANGTVLWSNTYNIGLNDSATDVVQLGGAGSGFAICGVTNSPGGCGGSRDAFILKLTATGAVAGVRVYGTQTTDEIAWGICKANFGGNNGTAVGDLIIAGSTTSQAGAARDGYIVRVNQNTLNIVWDKHYGGPTSSDDYFYDVIESQVGSLPGTAADIVAVGGTSTWGSGLLDAWIVRVNGSNGVIGLSPQGVGVYGGAQDDEARAVIEIQTNGAPGDLVAVGNSFSRGVPSTSSEVLLIETNADPCAWVADQYAGDNGTGADGGLDVKEDPYSTINVVVTGYTALGTGVFVAPNVFLNRFMVGTMAPVGGGTLYGGTGDDRGWSLNAAQNNVAGSETPGYIVAGYTQSANLIPAADPEQLYLIKTDAAFNSNCNWALFNFNAITPGFTPNCPAVLNSVVGPSCLPTNTRTPQTWGNQLCYAIPSNREHGNGGNDGVSGVESPAVISFNEGTVTSYPNPITSGTALNLRFDLASSADVQISVSDLVGHEIYQRSEHLESGSALHAIATDGWSSGAYLVRVTIGAKSATARVVVLGK